MPGKCEEIRQLPDVGKLEGAYDLPKMPASILLQVKFHKSWFSGYIEHTQHLFVPIGSYKGKYVFLVRIKEFYRPSSKKFGILLSDDNHPPEPVKKGCWKPRH